MDLSVLKSYQNFWLDKALIIDLATGKLRCVLKVKIDSVLAWEIYSVPKTVMALARP